MKAHPIADRFPMMSVDRLKELADDIAANGLIEPIVTHDGLILDGRNRFRACEVAGVSPRFVQWDGEGGTVARFVWSVNAQRRDITSSQRAAIWQDFLADFEADARKRQAHGQTAPGKTLVETIPQASSGKARDHAAAAADTNPRYISDAKALKAQAPDLLEKVRDGALSIPAAKKEARKREWTKRAEDAARKVHDAPERSDAPAIHHGDAVEWLHSLETGSVQCCITDPPYGLSVHRTRGGGHEYADGDSYALDLLDRTCAEMVRVLDADAHVYVFSGYTFLADFKAVLARHFDVQDNPIVWVKNRHTMVDFRRRYAPKHEYILFARQHGSRRLLNADCSPDVVEFSTVGGSPFHPSEKPADLLAHFIKNSTLAGEMVIDPFMGVGSAGVAALRNDRRFAGCDADPTFHGEAVRRMAELREAA